MNPSNKLLSDIVAFRTYSKFLPHTSRRETLEETINRNMIMHLDKFPKLSREIVKAFELVHEHKVLPSMRGLQFGGEAINKMNQRSFNCSYLPINDPRAFDEVLYLLLCGCGVGFSVQGYHIDQLPKIQMPKEEGMFIIHDSIQGWAQALQLLLESYFYGRIRPVFDFGNIRPKGSYLSTTGAKAPGPEPLKLMLSKVEEKLRTSLGRKLKDIEVHDIVCLIADCVLAGGIRRAALISLFDRDSKDMLTCKSGEWWIKAPQRARANNSAVLPRDEVTKDEFFYIYNLCKESNSGEPGFLWTNSKYDMGVNPCCEISLESNNFCNLTTVNQTGIKNKTEFLKRIHSATLLGTLQAAYTDFSYLRPIWKQTTEEHALLGLSFTGIADNPGLVTSEWLDEGSSLVLELNEKYAKKLGINVASRTTAIKPEGTASCVLGSSSGIHARHAQHYIRRIRINKNDPLAVYLQNSLPELVEEDKFKQSDIVLSIPQESPEGCILRDNESALDLFNRSLMYNKHWVAGGHRKGINRNNVSVTISVKDEEWDKLRECMWRNRESYTGVSLLPFNGSSYVQAPFETCSKEIFDELNKKIKDLDLKQVVEIEDNTNRIEQLACAGGQCNLE